jgi:uncharacterized protein DUF3667
MAASHPAACLNCGAALTGAYCARCGQKVTRPDPTLGAFLHETTHELAHWDGKVPATLKTLFLKPGLLTIDFLAGRRARWLSPLRVYLICSVALFAGRALVDEFGLRTIREMASFSFSNRQTTGPLTPEERQLIESGPIGRLFGADRLERVVADPTRLNREFEATLPRAMFVLLPVFALLTNLAWRKTEPRYPTHLYVALHIHAAIFGAMLLLTIAVGLSRSDAIAMVVAVMFLGYVLWYGLTALHRVFRDTWPVTILKATAVGIIYWICFLVLGIALLAYAVSRI